MKMIIAATVIAAAGFLYAADYALSLPDVVVSYETNQCVEVINYADTTGSCENMPSKFNHVWAE